jgi:hypothetical protein
MDMEAGHSLMYQLHTFLVAMFKPAVLEKNLMPDSRDIPVEDSPRISEDEDDWLKS